MNPIQSIHRRCIALFLCCALLFSLAACQARDGETSDGRNPKVEAVLASFFTHLQERDYDSAYALLSSQSQEQVNAVSFASTYSNFFNLMKITTISATVSRSQTETLHNVCTVSYQYHTNLGEDIANEQRVELVKQEDEWRLEWNPSLVHPDLSWDDRFVGRSMEAKRGEIFAQGQVVAANEPGISVLLVLDQIENEQQTVSQLSPLIHMEEKDIHQKLANAHPQAQVTVERLHLRSQPTTDERSDVLITLSQGEIVNLLDNGELVPALPPLDEEQDASGEEDTQNLVSAPTASAAAEEENQWLEEQSDDFYHVRYIKRIVPVDDSVQKEIPLADIIATSPTPTPYVAPPLPPTSDPVARENSAQEEIVLDSSATPESTLLPTDMPMQQAPSPTPLPTPAPTTFVDTDGTKTVTLEGYIYAPYVRARYSQDLVLLKTFRREQIDNQTMTLLKSIPGVRIDEGQYATYRYYPYGASMFHTIGYMGMISPEALEEHLAQCEKLGIEPRYNSTSQVGVSGLEKRYEDVLRGQDGYEIFIANENGVVKSMLYQKPAQNGLDIHLTIDPNLQKRSYDLLRLYLTPDQAGAIVTTDPLTGAVLSMASYPSVDPNQLYAMSANMFAFTVLENKLKPMYNRVTQGHYTPGSIFKPFTAVLGLETGAITAHTPFPYEVDIDEENRWDPRNSGYKSWGWPPIKRVDNVYGTSDFYNAMKMSDNIYFAWTAMKIGQEDFWEYCNTKLGFAQNIPFDLPVSTSSVFQVSDNDPSFNTKFLADSGYGQGKLVMSPLHAASIFGGFANEGDVMRPYIVESLKHSDGLEYITDMSVQPSIWKEGVISDPSALQAVNEGMRSVMAEGTGSSVRAPYHTAGKTGTAEINKKEKRELAWLLAFKYDDPKDFLACVVIECQERQGGARYAIISSLFDYDGNSDTDWQQYLDNLSQNNDDVQTAESIDPRSAVSAADSVHSPASTSSSANDSAPEAPADSGQAEDNSTLDSFEDTGIPDDIEDFGADESGFDLAEE